MVSLRGALLAFAVVAVPGAAFADFDPTTSSLSAQIVANPNYGFAADTGLLARYPMLEGAGTVLNDKSGNGNNIPITTTGIISGWTSNPVVPAWTSDFGLQFNTSTAYLSLPAAVQKVQTVEVMFGSAVQTKVTGSAASTVPNQQALTGYGGATPAPVMLLGTNYTANSNPNQGFATTYLGSYISGDNSAWGTSGTIDNGLHVAVMEINATSGIRSMWLDGVPLTTITSVSTSAPVASGGTWELGGSIIGTINNASTASGCNCIIYGAEYSTSLLSQQQISQDYGAWKNIATYKGISLSTAYGPKVSGGYIHTVGESISHGFGLSTPTTQAFSFVAAAGLASATGQAWTADTDGNDSSSSYTLVNNCKLKFPAITPGISGPKFAIFHDNGNAERGYNPWPDLSGSNAAGVTSIVFRDLSSLGSCAAIARANGWTTILGMEFSSGNTGIGADATQKDISNPIRRQYARQYFDAYFDEMNDPRLGADGAATANSASGNTTCTLGGTAGPTYLTGAVHPVACGQSILGQDLEVLIEYLNNSRNGVAPDTISSTSSTMLLTDAGNQVILTGTGATFTLLPYGGQMEGEVLATITNNGSAIDTILPGTEPNSTAPAGVDTINGVTTGFQIDPGQTVRFIVSRGSDAAGTGGIITDRPTSVLVGPVQTAAFVFAVPMRNVSVTNASSTSYAATLPSCVAALSGRSYGLSKVDNNTNPIAFTVASGTNAQTNVADSFSDGSVSISLASRGTSVTAQCNGSGVWLRGVE